MEPPLSLKPAYAIAALLCWLGLACAAMTTNNGLAIGLATGTYLLGATFFVIWAGGIIVHFSLRSLLIATTIIAVALGLVAWMAN